MTRTVAVWLSTLIFVASLSAQQAVMVDHDAANPAKSSPLPPISTLMQDVEHNEDTDQKLLDDYTYHVHTVEQHLDSNGNVKKTETTDSQSVVIDGVLVNRTVAKNGKPLTPEEAAKEDERINSVVAKDKERKARLESEGKPADSNGGEELTLSRILQLGTFSNEHRVMWNSRPTIVVDYTGDPKAKTRTRFETIFRDLVGTVWIDEQDRSIVRVQGHFRNDFKIGMGLIADVKRGSSFSATFTKINNEAWLPSEIDGQGKIRLLLFVHFDGRLQETMSNYQKFRTSSTIIPSDRLIGPDGKPVAAPLPNSPKP
jgi:hypothetical protein